MLPFESRTRTLSFDEKIARIQKCLPSGITEKALSQRDRSEGEKRPVRVMFCDMKARACLSLFMQESDHIHRLTYILLLGIHFRKVVQGGLHG
jgi:hypothetical protein